jgi:phosphohistidine phosphatase
MQIVIIRHGIAASAASAKSAQDDAGRSLTKEGRQKMRRAAKGLRQIIASLDLIATSPLARAAQTAQIVAGEFDGVKTVQVSALSPRKPVAALIEWLNAHAADATIALVGHEPHLSSFLCWLVTGLQESFVELKKGGMALLECDAPVSPGRAKLHWLLKPSQLRDLKS